MATVTTKAVRKQLQEKTDLPLDEHKTALKELDSKCYEKVNDEHASLKNKAIEPAIMRSERKAPRVKKEKKKREIDPTAKKKGKCLELSQELRAVTGGAKVGLLCYIYLAKRIILVWLANANAI